MREMKDSGVKWIGKIPVTWKVSKLKYVFADGEEGLKIGPFGSAMKGKTLEEGPYKIYNQAHLIQNDFSLNRHFVSEDTFNELINYEVHPGDILFSMMGTIGKCQIMPEGFTKGIMDSHLLKSGIKDNINPNFLVYAYDKDYSDQAYTQLLYASNGTIMNGLNSSILKSVVIALPPKNEQDRIVDYLDSKCSKIDSIIAKQEQIIEKLKEYKLSLITEAVTKGLNSNSEMKVCDSRWMSKIPAHWNIVKGHRIISFTQNGLTRRDLEKSEGCIVLKLKNISEDGIIDYSETNKIELTEQERKSYELKQGDLLFVRVNGSKNLVGKTAIFNDIGELVAYNDHIIRVRLNNHCNNRYLKYFLMSGPGKIEIETHTITSAGQYTISGDGLRDLSIPLPPLEEQILISDYLEKKTRIIDEQMTKKEKLIDKLIEYKKSLVYEVVTGKKEV